MKKALLLLSAVSLVLLCTTTSVLASGVDLTGIGSRAQAMGGNYRAVADDWSAMYWNPAGLAFTKGIGVGASFELVVPKATFMVGNSQLGTHFSTVYRTERANEPQTFLLPSAGVTLNAGKLAFGIGVWAPFGLGSKWDLLRTAANNTGNVPGLRFDTYSTKYPNFEYESNLQIIDVHPTISFKISDKLSVGAGASIIFNDIYIRQPVYIQNPYLYNKTLAQTLDAVATGFLATTLAGMRSSPFDHLLTQAELKGNGTGYGANFGMTFKPTKNLSVGASVQWYADQKLDGTFQNTIYFPDVPAYNSMAQTFTDSVFTKALQAGLITGDQYFILANYFSGQVVDEGKKDVKTSMPLPAKAGLGISYSGIRNLLISADVAYTQWSSWDKILVQNLNGGTEAELVENWENTIRFGFGLEYTAGTAKVRGGFYSEPPAAVDETLTVTIPDINRRNVVCFGLEFPVGPVSLALNYEHLFIADKTVGTWNYDTMTTAMNLAGTYTMNVNNILVGLDYHF
jgi:long-chain fatty acid transport protein